MNTPTKTEQTISLTEAVTAHFHLPHEYIHSCDKYYILYWQARYVYTLLLRTPRIVRENVPFIPVLQEGLTMEWIGKNPEAQLRCSFRKLKGHKTGYVVIRRPVSVTTVISKDMQS